jgi:ABC-type bacteriocin/lantibiotic exporter with double-glycine peptidase domain
VNLNVPIVKQATPASCGPACLLAVLRYWLGDDAPVAEADLYDLLEYDPKVGTDPRKLAFAARDVYGLTAGAVVGATVLQVANAVAGGTPVILQLQAWKKDDEKDYDEDWDDGHYVVAVGRRGKNLIVMDPLSPKAYRTLSAVDLRDRWHGYDGDKQSSGIAVYVSSKGDPRGEEPNDVGDPLP